MASLDDSPLSSPLEEKDTPYYPNKWIVDLIAPYTRPSYMDKVATFYRSTKAPTVLVGKQKHKLPFYRCNFSSKYLDTLSECGCDDPDALFGDFDVTLDPLFIILWTALNLNCRIFEPCKWEDFEKANFDTPLLVLDFLQPYDWNLIEQYLVWYQRIRIVPAPLVRFSYGNARFITWTLVDPKKRLYMTIVRNGYSIYEYQTDRNLTYHRFQSDTRWDIDVNIAHINSIGRSKISEGWHLFLEMRSECGEYGSDNGVIYLINYLMEIYSTTSERTIAQIVPNSSE